MASDVRPSSRPAAPMYSSKRAASHNYKGEAEFKRLSDWEARYLSMCYDQRLKLEIFLILILEASILRTSYIWCVKLWLLR
jgi:hypothetical protein